MCCHKLMFLVLPQHVLICCVVYPEVCSASVSQSGTLEKYLLSLALDRLASVGPLDLGEASSPLGQAQGYWVPVTAVHMNIVTDR